MPRKIFDYGKGIECWLLDGEFYVYGVTLSGDPRVCHSEGMARELAAGGVSCR
jgi:hypothetical protein